MVHVPEFALDFEVLAWFEVRADDIVSIPRTKVILTSFVGAEVFLNAGPCFYPGRFVPALFLALVPVRLEVLVMNVNVRAQLRLIHPGVVLGCLLLNRMKQQEVHAGIIHHWFFFIFHVDDVVINILLQEVHLLDVQPHVQGHEHVDEEGERPTDRRLVRIALLVEVQLNDVPKQVEVLQFQTLLTHI